MDWASRAACIDKDPTLFFPSSELDSAYDEARLICETCPVWRDCLTDALVRERENRSRWGMWGGLTPTERERLVTIGRVTKRRVA
jgi:WhiB family redox-sensing transcriptional regulator